MENKNNNIFLGKIEKSGCYVNNGKYGYFLTCGKKNYKIPEWLEPEEITGKLHFFLEILAFFQKIKKLFGKMARFSPFFWKSDFSKILNFFFSFGGRLRIMFHASENYF